MIPNKSLNRIMKSETISKNRAGLKNQTSRGNIKIVSLILFCFFCIISLPSYGAYLSNVPITITQPDGTVINCFVTGDEYYNWAHDSLGYTIVQNPTTGYYYYATLDNDSLVCSNYIFGNVLPRSVNIQPNVNISLEKLKKIVTNNPIYQDNLRSMEERKANSIQTRGNIGTVNNLVVYIRFADQKEFDANQNTYTAMFNSTASGYNSMRNYFQEVSYNQLDIISHFYPSNNGTVILSYQDVYNLDYYRPYHAVTNPIGYSDLERRDREHTLLSNAIDYIKNQVPTSLNLDYNNDGNVDNICFIIRSGGNSGSLLLPHKWFIHSQFVYINGKRAYDYNLISDGNSNGILCHEMNHTFGAPDLYHNADFDLTGGVPVGIWDVMANQQNPPQHMGAYMKYKYGGWIPSIPVITNSGTYTLQPLTSSTNNCYEIPISGSLYQYESIILEYREKAGTFENSLPGRGLIIYRVHKGVTGNYYGIGHGGKYDEVYVFRPNGTNLSSGNLYEAMFPGTSGRTTFSNSTNPYGFILTGDYIPFEEHSANVYIKNIRENSNGTLSFDVRFCDDDDVTYSNTSNLPPLTNASNSIQTSGTVIVKSTDNVIFEAGNEVILNPGFEVQVGGTFEININDCGN